MKPRSAPAVLGLAIAIPLLPSRIQEACVADSGATAPVCADGQPRVCVTRVHAAALDRLVGPAREALAILSAKLPEPPVEVREAETRWVAGPQPPATVFVELSGNPDPRTIQRLRWALLEGAGTRPCIPLTSHEDVVAREQAGRLAMAAWLLEQAPPAGALRRRAGPAGMGLAAAAPAGRAASPGHRGACGRTGVWRAGSDPCAEDPRFHAPIAILAATVGVIAAGPGLVGADPALERTAAIVWPRRRGLHLATAVTMLALVLASTTLVGAAMSPSTLLVRNAAGLGGLLGVGAAALGAHRAWLLPLLATGPGVMLGPLEGAWYREVLTWTAQPGGRTSATITATLLGTAGALAYAWRGAGR